MKGRTDYPLIQKLLTHGSKQKPIDMSVKRLILFRFITNGGIKRI